MDVPVQRRICILVKAYPQPSHTYGQTVCCAGITDTGEFLRLYPIPYLALKPDQRFERFDWIEAKIWPSGGRDHRPESHKVDPDSIRIISPKSKRGGHHELWLPHVSESFQALKDANQGAKRVSLGIVRPDSESVRFITSTYSDSAREEKETALEMQAQELLFAEEKKVTIPIPEKLFKYRFRSGNTKHDMTIHDWEVQAAYYNFKRLYGQEALDKLNQQYQDTIPYRNLHFIMGTQLSRPKQFMIIGLLRFGGDIEAIAAQESLF